MAVPTITPGSWTPTFGSGGVTSNFGASRQYRDGIFIRTVFLQELSIEQRMNDLPILKNSGERVPQVTSRKGQRYTVPTKSVPAVSDMTTSFTTSAYSYPDYVATDTFTEGGNNFGPTITAGTSVIGLPLPLQRINEGEAELLINQYRGLAMAFTREYLEISMLQNPSQYYADLIKYALNNDLETYAWLTCQFIGPITETADDYGTLFNDAIGITNKANNTLTRTLTSIGTNPNSITAQTTGSATGMSNSSNSRFGTTPLNVPWLFGSTASDISYTTIARLSEKFDSRNVPMSKRNLYLDNKGYNDVSHLPQFVYADVKGTGAGSNVNTDARIRGTIHGFNVYMTNVIQPTGASSNQLNELALADDTLAWGVQIEPNLIVDDMLTKKEQAIVLMATERYGVTAKRPDHMAIVQTRTRV